MTDLLPEAFKKRMKEQLKENFAPFIEALHKPAAISIRLNPEKFDKELSLQKVSWSRYGYYLEERPLFVMDPLFHAGCYYIQEASSMLLENVLRQLQLDKKKVRVLDLCGAPGGKATNILATITNDSLLFTNETIRSRADILKENIYKWGYENVIVTNNDPSTYSRLKCFFDIIVVDAPCSGEGLFRKDPAAIDQWSESNLQLCCERQQRIMHDVWPSLRENGHLIYSTCTYNPEENENNIIRFMKSGEARSVPLDLVQHQEITEVMENDMFGYYAYPHKNRGEGFFISVLQKTSGQDAMESGRKKPKEIKKKLHFPKEINGYVNNGEDLIEFREGINIFPQEHHELTEAVIPKLNVVTLGIPVASVKQKNIIPDPAIAMANATNHQAFNTIGVSYEQALRFLHKDMIDHADLIKGYNLITYKGFGLGWIKKIDDRRSNNNFPKEWRIRMDLPGQLAEIERQLPLNN